MGSHPRCIYISLHHILQAKREAYANADSLSQLPLYIVEAPEKTAMPGETVLLLHTLEESPVTQTLIKQWTDRDPLLSHVRLHMLQNDCQNRYIHSGRVTTLSQAERRAEHSRLFFAVGKQDDHS